MKVLKNAIRYKHETDEGKQTVKELDGYLQIELTADEMIEFVQSGDPSELVNEVCGHELHCIEAKLTNGYLHYPRDKSKVSYCTRDDREVFIFDLEIVRWSVV